MNPLAPAMSVDEMAHTPAPADDGTRARELEGSWSQIAYVTGISVSGGVLLVGIIGLCIVAFSTRSSNAASPDLAQPDA